MGPDDSHPSDNAPLFQLRPTEGTEGAENAQFGDLFEAMAAFGDDEQFAKKQE